MWKHYFKNITWNYCTQILKYNIYHSQRRTYKLLKVKGKNVLYNWRQETVCFNSPGLSKCVGVAVTKIYLLQFYVHSFIIWTSRHDSEFHTENDVSCFTAISLVTRKTCFTSITTFVMLISITKDLNTQTYY